MPRPSSGSKVRTLSREKPANSSGRLTCSQLTSWPVSGSASPLVNVYDGSQSAMVDSSTIARLRSVSSSSGRLTSASVIGNSRVG